MKAKTKHAIGWGILQGLATGVVILYCMNYGIAVTVGLLLGVAIATALILLAFQLISAQDKS